ncbi:DUF937 domain-containing protein [Capnocytophaga catalasegens]|uniref:DUF937 domain-containing protein n=1 Tax=Capnocytophaga catalasegens TaxID=1004260 RepID=A0AAV5AZK6_9FLAO|nr:DUF937 domain-containing protein [Capnocytophaga catalasegens]GIZ14687.1 hypothetical protein RCZ03_06880 [Capnocytophaga catalasegens]GJM51203.1 hypothetical protein RCZ15_21760 [Capnocytophaga catalasegens]GJM52278.1 hypothetical protein RCZ16_05960 [Capnocytophaga catalasegens]
MSSILDSLGGSQLIDGITKQTGVSVEQTSSVLSMALPLLMGAMQKNSETEQGASNLLNALQSDKHNGSLLSNIGGFLGGTNSDLTSDGAGILGHLLGDKTASVENAISTKTGVSSSVSQILKMAAPFLMSFLGKQISDNKVNSASGLGSVLESVLGSKQGGNMLTSLLDSNGDGNILGSIGSLFGGKK